MLSIQELECYEEQGVPLKVLKHLYMLHNMINVGPKEVLYRIFSYKRLLQSIKDKSLTLVKPHKWKDPFENFFLKSKGVLSDGSKVSFESIRESFYGQCWTTRKECEGLWKVHSSDCTGVKVKTNVFKLFKYLYDMGNPYHTLSYFVGKVRYLSDKQIKEYCSKDINEVLTSDCKGTVKTLLIKRLAFDYEQEVRLIFRVPNNEEEDYNNVKNNWNKKEDIFKFKINPNDLFDEITFNPRIDDNEFKKLSKELRNNGYNGKIIKSDLFDDPNFVIQL